MGKRDISQVDDDEHEDRSRGSLFCGQKTGRVAVKAFGVSSDLLALVWAGEAYVEDICSKGPREFL